MANKSKNIKIGCLWLRTYKKEGKKVQYFSGVLEDISGSIQIVVFANNKKEKENQPGFIIYRSEKEKKEEYETKQPEIQEPQIDEPMPEEEIDIKDIPI